MYINIAGVYTRYTVDSHLKYYTDYHDVDEDMTSICIQCGDWHMGSMIGVTYRSMNDLTTAAIDGRVASSINAKCSIYGLSRCRRRYDGHFGLWWELGSRLAGYAEWCLHTRYDRYPY